MRHYRIANPTHTGGLPEDEHSARIDTNDYEWFVVQTPPMCEFDAEAILTKCGFTVMCPIKRSVTRVNRRAKRKRVLEFPLLKGYVLAGFDGEPNWYEFFKKGRERGVVANVVRFDGKAAPIPPRSKNWVQSMYESTEPVTNLTPEANEDSPALFQPGDEVRVTEGPLAGQTAVVHTVGGGRVRVVVNFFGGEQFAQIPVDSICEVA